MDMVITDTTATNTSQTKPDQIKALRLLLELPAVTCPPTIFKYLAQRTTPGCRQRNTEPKGTIA